MSTLRTLPGDFKLLGDTDILYPTWERKLLDNHRMQNVASYVIGVNRTWPPQAIQRTATIQPSTTSGTPSVSLTTPSASAGSTSISTSPGTSAGTAGTATTGTSTGTTTGTTGTSSSSTTAPPVYGGAKSVEEWLHVRDQVCALMRTALASEVCDGIPFHLHDDPPAMLDDLRTKYNVQTA